jgi:hypothetical protein
MYLKTALRIKAGVFMSEVNKTNPYPSTNPTQGESELDQMVKDMGMEEYSSIDDLQEEVNYGGIEGTDEGISLVEGEEPAGDSYSPADITTKMFRELQSKVRDFHPKTEEEEKELQDLLKEINQGLKLELKHQDNESSEIYSKALAEYSILTGDTSLGEGASESPGDTELDEVLGELGIERGTSEGLSAEAAVGEEVVPPYGGGDSPTRVESGKNFYEGEQFTLKVPSKATAGEAKTNVIKGNGSYTLNPGDKDVKLSKKGERVFATVGEFAYVFDKNASLYIEAEPSQITGNVPNNDGKITAGLYEPQPFISQSEINNVAKKINDGASKVSLGVHKDNIFEGYIANDGGVYATDDEVENRDVKNILPRIADAIRERDPEEKKEKWESILDTLSRWNSQNSKKGNVNDRGQLLFNVLYGELGERGLKNALKNEIIPGDIARKISELLNADASELSTNDAFNAQAGSPSDMTHQTSADFLNNYAGSGEDSIE